MTSAPDDLGPRDDARFQSLDGEERERLLVYADLCLHVLDARPDQAEALELAASALTALGYYETGLACDRRLERLYPDDATILYNLACSLALTGQADDAIETLERAIAIGYRDGRHMLSDDDLEPLRDHPRFLDLVERAARG